MRGDRDVRPSTGRRRADKRRGRGESTFARRRTDLFAVLIIVDFNRGIDMKSFFFSFSIKKRKRSFPKRRIFSFATNPSEISGG